MSRLFKGSPGRGAYLERAQSKGCQDRTYDAVSPCSVMLQWFHALH